METITLYVDDRQIKTRKNATVLEAALEAGIYIPHLCYHPDLEPAGSCRICLVEIEGFTQPVTSCNTVAENNMVVRTKTPKVDKLRKLSMEMMLASHPADCTTCPKYLKCELQSLAQYLGISDTRLKRRNKSFPLESSNPLFVHDFTRCVLCGRCIRACHLLREAEVLEYGQKTSHAYRSEITETSVGIGQNSSLVEANCRFCGACAEVCPTGAIRDKDEVLKSAVSRKEALLPCRYNCPAQIDVPQYVRLVKEGQCSEALAVIREKVPFPAVLGRICNHPCEDVCRRQELNESVNIRELKRLAAEKGSRDWLKRTRREKPTGKKVAVVGSGPAGLTAAYYLSMKGHGVSVFEALPYAGGMLRVGIPEYRLPRDIVEEEIKLISDCGVEIKTSSPVESCAVLFEEGFDSVILAVGTHNGIKLPIPGADLDGVMVNIDFLRRVSLGEEVEIGRRVMVLGGGNVALDCARTAIRLGASEVSVACLECFETMPSSVEEINESKEEGVKIYPSLNFVEITGESGKVTGVKCLDVESFTFDEHGKLQLETIAGSEQIIPADTVIFAVGQRPLLPEDLKTVTAKGGLVAADSETLFTGVENVFAAGDVVSGTASVIEAIASGRKVASTVDQQLGGDGNIDEKLSPEVEVPKAIGCLENFASLHRKSVPCLSVEERTKSFLEINTTFEEEEARKEALRCLQCDLRLEMTRPLNWGDYSSKKSLEQK